MKLGTMAQNPLEWGVLQAGLVPTPLFDTIIALLLARSVMVGTRVGAFETLKAGPLPAEEIAARCQVDSTALSKLLGALAGTGYLTFRDGQFELTPLSRKWLLKSAPQSLYDAVLLQFVDAGFIDQMESFVRTGEPVHIHEEMSEED
jgi:hypothetical protein